MATQKNKSRGLYAPGNARSRPLNDETALADAGFAPTPNYDNLVQAAELTPVVVPAAVFAAPQSLEGELIPVGGRGGVIQIPASESYIKSPISFPTQSQLESMSQQQLGNFINAMMSKADWYNNPELAPTDLYREYHQVLSEANRLLGSRSNKIHPIGSINDSDIAQMLGFSGAKYLRSTGDPSLPTQAQVDQMTCAQLQVAWTAHEADASYYSAQPGPVYGQWQQIGTYIKTKLDACPIATPAQAPAPPINVSITGPTNITLPINSVTLNAVVGNAVDGDTYSFLWQQMSGPNQAQVSAQYAQSATFSNLAAGTYEFMVTVQNKAGTQTANETSVIVNQSNTPPVVQLGAVGDISLPVNTVMIDGSTSYNPDGGGLSYQWTKISGPQATIAKPTSPLTNISDLVAGAYTFRLTVTNNENISASADVSFNVYGGQTPPATPTPSNIPVDDHSTATVTDTPPTIGVTVPIVPVITTPIAPYTPSYGGGGGGGGGSSASALPLATDDNHWIRDLLIIAAVTATIGFLMYKKSMPSVGQVNPA